MREACGRTAESAARMMIRWIRTSRLSVKNSLASHSLLPALQTVSSSRQGTTPNCLASVRAAIDQRKRQLGAGNGGPTIVERAPKAQCQYSFRAVFEPHRHEVNQIGFGAGWTSRLVYTILMYVWCKTSAHIQPDLVHFGSNWSTHGVALHWPVLGTLQKVT